MKKTVAALMLSVLALALSGCIFTAPEATLYRLPKLAGEYESLEARIDTLLAMGGEYAAPTSGSNLQSVQMIDLDSDGVEEAVAFFRFPSDKKPMKIYIFKANGDSYEQYACIEGTSTLIYSVNYADLDGDGRREILVGYRSSSDVQGLSIYPMTAGSPEALLITGYSRYANIDMNGDGKQELLILCSDTESVGRVDYYDWADGTLTMRYSMRLSLSLAEVSRLTVGTLAGGENALFVTEVTADNLTVTDVLALRKRLYALGYYTKPNENPLYTESTADVIEMFQADCGLEETGVADPYTQALLFDDRMLAREGSAQEVTYLSNKAQPLMIQRAEITSYSFYGSVQVSVRNNTTGKLTAFGLKIIPNTSDGTPADMADTFAEEIEKEYAIDDIAIAKGNSYSDFATNGKAPLYNDPEDYEEPEIGEVEIYPHHFQVSYKNYFSGAQVAVCWYRAAGRNVYVDDDQMVFIPVGKGADDVLMNTLPISISDSETENARTWEMGIVARYVLPIYQDYYSLPQGAYLRSVEDGSPAQDAGLQEGDIIVGIGEQTILGDRTLRLSRASFAPGDIQTVYFWRDGQYYTTEMMRPET